MSKGVVIVTGAAAGIGRACVERLAAEGWTPALFDRDAAALDKASALLGAVAHCSVALDVADEAAVDAAVERAAALGPIRGLVNSAGIASDTPFFDTTVDLFRRILDVNVIGSFVVARAAATRMKETGGGAIVNIASVSGMRGNMGRTAYGASKGAVITMTKVMATELAIDNIRVNAVSPGPVETDMVRQMHTQESRAAWIRHVPMRRYSDPGEIAEPVLFLLGDKASYITGHVLAVDGGFIGGGTVRPLDA